MAIAEQPQATGPATGRGAESALADRFPSATARYLLDEPVAASVAVGVVAAALTNSIAAFVIGAIAAWIVARRVSTRHDAD